MAVYDVTVTLRAGMPVYPGEPGPEVEYFKLISEGSSSNVSKLSMGSHCGTHIDAPYHFIEGRAMVDALPLKALIGPVHVVEHHGEDHIAAADLEAFRLPADARRLLAKTRNGRLWEHDEFRTDFVAFAPDAGQWLVDRGFLLVGIDYLSMERFHAEHHEVHLALLEAGVVIVEGLDMRQVPPGHYNIACAPLKIADAEGAPARVFLWDELPG
ncbi:MAG TPA: cyclase family protein [Dehalococcoidia bacterium]|nr:cyclase family protein [Dehalococcoidia bacterium]